MSYVAELHAQHIARRRAIEERGVPDYGINLRPRQAPMPKPAVPAEIVPAVAKRFRPYSPRRMSVKKKIESLLFLLCEKHSSKIIERLSEEDRHRVVSVARRHFYFLARYVYQLGWAQIGRSLKKDHSSAVIGCRKLSRICRENIDVAQEMAEMEHLLRERTEPRGGQLWD